GIDLDNIRIKKAVGGAINESELVEGVLIQKERVQENMPYYIEDARVAIYGGKFEVRETELDSEVNVSDPAELQLFLDQEQQQLKDMVNKLVELKANVLFTDAGIHDVAQHFLAEAGILAVRRTKASDQKAIARATGARIVTNFDDIKETDLGHAGEVVQQDLGGDQHIFITDVKDAKAVTLILRGGTEHVVDEVERAIDDSLGVVRATIEDGKVVAGGGSPELEVALGVRDFAESVGGREQLAIEAFADAVEVIPRTLAENAGLDPIDSIVSLRSQHDGGNVSAGLNADTGDVIDMAEEGVYEPLRVKTQAIKSATEAAIMILRIDDVIAASDAPSGGQPSPEELEAMMGGMGGMG
ncbi:MAG TPA: thermosome subunit, partial [Halobacteriales archaeon]|nr:thermosome subunit [Halobacteriales archaeon]